MLREFLPFRTHNRLSQSLAIIAVAIVQIATTHLTEWLGVGQDVATRSAIASHPLMPLGPAFIIWGAIYAFALVAAVWQLLPAQKYNHALEQAGWNIAGVGLLCAAWQIWVPLNGFDWISTILVGLALVVGVAGLLRLRQDDMLSRMDTIMVFAPLALVTGWLTAACFLNFTSELVAGQYGLDPTHMPVSLGFLIGLIVFGGLMTHLTESLTFGAALVWALSWVMAANLLRDHEPAMVTTAVVGIIAVAIVCAWSITHHHETGPMTLRRG